MTTLEFLPATRAFLAKPARMLIGGQWRDAADGGTLPSIDPATAQTLATFPAGTTADADEAASNKSGWRREKGAYGLNLFTQIKSVIINWS